MHNEGLLFPCRGSTALGATHSLSLIRDDGFDGLAVPADTTSAMLGGTTL